MLQILLWHLPLPLKDTFLDCSKLILPREWHSSPSFEIEVFPITNTQGVIHLMASDESQTQGEKKAQQAAWPDKPRSLLQTPRPPDGSLEITLLISRNCFSRSPGTPSLTHRGSRQTAWASPTCPVSGKPPPHCPVLILPTGVRLLLRFSQH